MDFNELMQSFAAKLGMPSLHVENDMAAIEIDDIAIGFIHNPGEGTLIVAADLGLQSVNADGAFGAMMLKANHLFEATRGATLFQNPANEAFGLQQMFRLVDLDVDRLSEEVKKIADLAHEWKGIVAGCAHAETAAKAIKAESDEAFRRSFVGDGLLRV